MEQCTACKGTYEKTTADGMQYFHRCPPLSAVELAAAVTAGKVQLPIDPVTTLAETPDVAVTRRVYERGNLRDENVKTDGTLKQAGAGTKTVAAPTSGKVTVP